MRSSETQQGSRIKGLQVSDGNRTIRPRPDLHQRCGDHGIGITHVVPGPVDRLRTDARPGNECLQSRLSSRHSPGKPGARQADPDPRHNCSPRRLGNPVDSHHPYFPNRDAERRYLPIGGRNCALTPVDEWQCQLAVQLWRVTFRPRDDSVPLPRLLHFGDAEKLRDLFRRFGSRKLAEDHADLYFNAKRGAVELMLGETKLRELRRHKPLTLNTERGVNQL
jgi:hypothetical protein